MTPTLRHPGFAPSPTAPAFPPPSWGRAALLTSDLSDLAHGAFLTSTRNQASRAGGGRNGCRRWAGRRTGYARTSLSTGCARGAANGGNVHGLTGPLQCTRQVYKCTPFIESGSAGARTWTGLQRPLPRLGDSTRGEGHRTATAGR